MKITKCTYENPDSDGDIRVESELLIENDSEFDVEFVKGSCIVVNEDGITIGGSEIEDDSVFIGAKDSCKLDSYGLSERVHKNHFKDRKASDSKVYINVTTYRREFVKIGTLDVPSKPGELSVIKKVISLGGAAECMGVSCLRKKDNDDGEMELEFTAGIRNTSDDYIAKAQVTVKAMDQRDAQIEDNVDYCHLPAKSGKVFTPSFWGLKYGKLKNGEFKVTASVFLPISNYSAEAVPALSDD
tara:strand:- start:2777 stop:3505 length:729 start_codon:yes stop_codon:yes gene_type:complete